MSDKEKHKNPGGISFAKQTIVVGQTNNLKLIAPHANINPNLDVSKTRKVIYFELHKKFNNSAI